MSKILSREARTVMLGDTSLCYELQRKRVKNINLHVRNGQVWVSAPSSVSLNVIEGFLRKKGRLILQALAHFPKKTETFTKAQEKARKERCAIIISAMCREFYARIPDWGIVFPELRFRKMSSRWGSCNPQKGILTFSTALSEMPKAFCEYVVAHEFVHFREANHSPSFYRELSKYMPDYRERKRLHLLS